MRPDPFCFNLALKNSVPLLNRAYTEINCKWIIIWHIKACPHLSMTFLSVYTRLNHDENIITTHSSQCLPASGVVLAPSCCVSQTDRAVQLLLETSADNPSYYCDSLKACLVTTITSSGPSQSTIKLVATNMIANGKLAGNYHLLQPVVCFQFK